MRHSAALALAICVGACGNDETGVSASDTGGQSSNGETSADGSASASGSATDGSVSMTADPSGSSDTTRGPASTGDSGGSEGTSRADDTTSTNGGSGTSDAGDEATASAGTTSGDGTTSGFGTNSGSGGSSDGGTTDGTTGTNATTESGSEEESSTGSTAICGDGLVEGSEECDDANANAADGCHVDCTVHELVFVTSVEYMGDMGGLAGADANCQDRADAAGLPGAYKAWLSTATLGPATTFTQATVPYRLVNGTLIANDWTDLTDGALQAPINADEFGAPPPAASACGTETAYVYSNTTASGTPVSNEDCGGWASLAESSIRVGLHTSTTGFWTAGCSYGVLIRPACTRFYPIYCFGQ